MKRILILAALSLVSVSVIAGCEQAKQPAVQSPVKPAPVVPQPFAYKGSYLGEPIEEFKGKHPELKCTSNQEWVSDAVRKGKIPASQSDSVPGMYLCEVPRYSETIADAKVYYGSYEFRNDKLSYINFYVSPWEFAQLHDAFASRYGAPTDFTISTNCHQEKWSQSSDPGTEVAIVLDKQDCAHIYDNLPHKPPLIFVQFRDTTQDHLAEKAEKDKANKDF